MTKQSLEMATSLFGTLEVCHDQSAHSAAMNMAIDETLLERVATPTIRFYRWQSAALSFGYFGRFTDIASYENKRDLVRRWTGGGIVFHGEDLTYSIVIPGRDTAFTESSISIYEKIHRALVDALIGMGKAAVVAGGVASGSIAAATQTAVNASGYNCFAHPVHADVMIEGRKVGGAAQRRTRHGLLQQGSIQGVDIAIGLSARFARALSPNRRERNIDGEILNRAQELVERKYGTDAWLRKR
jgi:lipoate-protein ligase A